MQQTVEPPKPTESWLNKIYISHILSTWGDRSWEFLVPVALAELFSFTLLPVSLILLVQNIFCALLVSFMGTMVDKTSRVFTVTSSLIIQNTMVCIASMLLLAMWWMFTLKDLPFCGEYDDNRTCILLWNDTYFICMFIALCIVNSASALFSVASSIAVERDWVVVLCKDDHFLLTKTNSVMQRIDLISKVGSPTVLGFILQFTPLPIVLIAIAIWNIASLFPELGLLLSIYNNNETILSKTLTNSSFIEMEDIESAHLTIIEEEKEMEEEALPIDDGHHLEEKESILTLVMSTIRGWRVYLSHEVFLASMSYVFLYCTVLAPGGLFNAYLKIEGVEDWMLGAVTGIAAIVGLIATFLQPPLVIKFGPKVTGNAMLYFQFCILVPAVLGIYWQTEYGLYSLMILVALARFPLWAFDLVERQIMQVSIAKHERGIINSVESSFTNIATLLMYILGSIFSDPDDFIILAIFSVLAVFFSAMLFSLWGLWSDKQIGDLVAQDDKETIE